MFRRPSGVYVARLVVPLRLRQVVGQVELIHSTGSRDTAVAKVVAAGMLAGWRRQLQTLERGDYVDVLQLKTGSPKLRLSGYLPLRQAGTASGIELETLIRQAALHRLDLFVDPGRHPGFIVPLEDLERDPRTGSYEVPLPKFMPASAAAIEFSGTLQVKPTDVTLLASELVSGAACLLVSFLPLAQPGTLYCPKGGLEISEQNLLARTDQIEALRASLALGITEEQLAAARALAKGLDRPVNPLARRRVLDVLEDFMSDRARHCAPDQARRIRAACELFAELTGNPSIGEVDRTMLRHYRDKLLPSVPAHENKIRLKHGTTGITESIERVAGTEWPKISSAEVSKRMQWLASLFEWLVQEKCIPDDPAVGLSSAIRPRKSEASRKARDLFTRDDLQKIFSAAWYETGKGELTRQGTYREFLPCYYWLPLLGLYYGARMNELCQLSLADIQQTDTGTWFIDMTDEDDGDGEEAGRKRLKNANSVRRVPLHPHLIELGLLEWRTALADAGHIRLFPELLYNERKGYSAAPVKWFSGYLQRLGWPRTGRKVFHSFRHTLVSECLNKLGLTPETTAQISGHERRKHVMLDRYTKDAQIDELLGHVSRIDFKLPGIAAFDVPQGQKALGDALRRKRK